MMHPANPSEKTPVSPDKFSRRLTAGKSAESDQKEALYAFNDCVCFLPVSAALDVGPQGRTLRHLWRMESICFLSAYTGCIIPQNPNPGSEWTEETDNRLASETETSFLPLWIKDNPVLYALWDTVSVSVPKLWVFWSALLVQMWQNSYPSTNGYSEPYRPMSFHFMYRDPGPSFNVLPRPFAQGKTICRRNKLPSLSQVIHPSGIPAALCLTSTTHPPI